MIDEFYSFVVYLDLRYDGRTYQTGDSSKVRGLYNLFELVNGMPNYRSDFDDGKYSIWICQAASNYYWIIGSTDDMPNCIGIAYR